jgi:hypothetical protein
MRCARRAPTRALLLAALAATGGAQAQLRAPEPAVVFELATLSGALSSPGVLRRDGGHAFDQLVEPAQVRARWWWRAGQLELGTGTDWSTDRTLQPQSGRPVLGLRTELTSQTRFVYEFRPPERYGAFGGALPPDAAAPGDMRWVLEFKPSNPVKSTAHGLLRVELSSGSTLALRPRGGGLAMSWNSRW